MTAVVVFDYGFGNVRSMVRALAGLGVDVSLSADHRAAYEADGLVVPGVGAFAACMEGLTRARGDRLVRERIRDGRPVLGVCVGEQIMFEHGRERGHDADGLALIGGDVEPLDADVVPHMGWDEVDAPSDSVLLHDVGDERFYFVHSYAAMDVRPLPGGGTAGADADADERVTWCTYGRSRFVAAYERGPLFATQFHPEKSAGAGLHLLRNWLDVL